MIYKYIILYIRYYFNYYSRFLCKNKGFLDFSNRNCYTCL